jgi:hypothetical protein
MIERAQFRYCVMELETIGTDFILAVAVVVYKVRAFTQKTPSSTEALEGVLIT